jgi:hypothetical protein
MKLTKVSKDIYKVDGDAGRVIFVRTSLIDKQIRRHPQSQEVNLYLEMEAWRVDEKGYLVEGEVEQILRPYRVKRPIPGGRLAAGNYPAELRFLEERAVREYAGLFLAAETI